MDRAELGAFLRSRRERIQPSDVGVPAGTRRRTPGLRREEVAQLAHISTEYYTRLEQARGPHPSQDVLAALTRALRLTDAEREHLHHLAGAPAAPPPGPPREVRRSIVDLIERLPNAAAVVTSSAFEVLAWNRLACALMEDFSAVSPRERNFARRAFLRPEAERLLYDVSDLAEFRVYAAHQLRATAARYPTDPSLRALIRELRTGSPVFEELWASHDVTRSPQLRKTFAHPVVGPVTVNCDVLDLADSDQRVVIYTAVPGSADEDLLRVLSVVGTQRLDLAR
jgi:transcriptional regulator with XRE-family HTH domain